MPLAAYPDVSFFVRAVHVLPVIAVAAAVGGIIGGFTVYAVDSALTWPQPSSQRPDVRADNQSGSQSSAAVEEKTRPVRIVGGAIPDPSAGMSAPPPAQSRQSAPQQSVTQQNPAQLSPQILAAKPLESKPAAGCQKRADRKSPGGAAQYGCNNAAIHALAGCAVARAAGLFQCFLHGATTDHGAAAECSAWTANSQNRRREKSRQ